MKKKKMAFLFVLSIRFLYFLDPKFTVSSHLMCIYSSVYVGPVLKPVHKSDMNIEKFSEVS